MQGPIADGNVLIGGIQIFGFLLSLGILTGFLLLRTQAERAALPLTFCSILYFVSVPIGLVGSHAFELLCYHPDRLFSNPALLLKLNDGISSFGMIFTGIVWIAIFSIIARRTDILLSLWDCFCLALLGILLYVRMGCALVGDHPGRLSNFFLAVSFPDGRRHDLGYYELLFLAFILIPLLWRLAAGKPSPGFIMGVFAFCYGLFRVFVDSLRVADVRYFEWTPGQYSALVLMAFGIFILARAQNSHVSVRPISSISDSRT